MDLIIHRIDHEYTRPDGADVTVSNTVLHEGVLSFTIDDDDVLKWRKSASPDVVGTTNVWNRLEIVR